MEVRVYLEENPPAVAVAVAELFRIYDNGLCVGELIGDNWRSYERIYTNGKIELRKVTDHDPELNYLSIETTTYTKGMFVQWPLGLPIPPEVPAHLHFEIESLCKYSDKMPQQQNHSGKMSDRVQGNHSGKTPHRVRHNQPRITNPATHSHHRRSNTSNNCLIQCD